MQKVILYIQPQLRNTTTTQDFVRVDLMEEELISLTQVIQNENDIDKIINDYISTGLVDINYITNLDINVKIMPYFDKKLVLLIDEKSTVKSHAYIFAFVI